MGSTWPFLGDPTVASGGWQRTAPGGFDHQGPDAPSAHRRPGYPLSGCVPAEPDSVSPGNIRVTSVAQRDKPPSDTGVMPPKIHHIETPVHPEASQLVCARAWRTDGVQSIEACGPNGTMLRARWHYSLCSPRPDQSIEWGSGTQIRRYCRDLTRAWLSFRQRPPRTGNSSIPLRLCRLTRSASYAS